MPFNIFQLCLFLFTLCCKNNALAHARRGTGSTQHINDTNDDTLPELQPSAGPSLSSDSEDEALLMWELDSDCVESVGHTVPDARVSVF